MTCHLTHVRSSGKFLPVRGSECQVANWERGRREREDGGELLELVHCQQSQKGGKLPFHHWYFSGGNFKWCGSSIAKTNTPTFPIPMRHMTYKIANLAERIPWTCGGSAGTGITDESPEAEAPVMATAGWTDMSTAMVFD